MLLKDNDNDKDNDRIKPNQKKDAKIFIHVKQMRGTPSYQAWISSRRKSCPARAGGRQTAVVIGYKHAYKHFWDTLGQMC